MNSTDQFRDFWESGKYVLVKVDACQYTICTRDSMAILIDEDDALVSEIIARMLKEGVQIAKFKDGKLVDGKTELPIDNGKN